MSALPSALPRELIQADSNSICKTKFNFVLNTFQSGIYFFNSAKTSTTSTLWKNSSPLMALLDHVDDDDKRNNKSLSSLQQGQRLRQFQKGKSPLKDAKKMKCLLIN